MLRAILKISTKVSYKVNVETITMVSHLNEIREKKGKHQKEKNKVKEKERWKGKREEEKIKEEKHVERMRKQEETW